MRRYTPKEGSVIAGIFVPGETIVAVDQYASVCSRMYQERSQVTDFI